MDWPWHDMSYLSDNIRFQAKRHPLVVTGNFKTVEEYCLFLIHLKAYEEAARLARGKVVLDVGCNKGYGTRVIGANCKKIIGVDVSHKAIEYAQRKYKSHVAEFQALEGDQLPFDERMFDLVTVFQVIEHIHDCNAFLSEIRRVLKPGGRVILTTPNARLRLQPGMKPWNKFHVREFDANQLADLLSLHFPVVTVRGIFAGEPLNSIERNRLKREKNRTANADRNGFFGQLKALLPKQIYVLLRILKARAKEAGYSQSVKSFILQHGSTSCLFLSDYDNENALDLIAFCGTTSDV
jgi:2-polyprenyl-3-methyl-5-hydroxy-6-metoxy-1,4-benzoquinol methylase